MNLGRASEAPVRFERIASSFVRARRQAQALAEFPGPIPATLAEGYASQDLAIQRWPDRLVGWKVGYIAPERRDVTGEERVVGPIFAAGLRHDRAGQSTPFPVFVGGFAAVEAEFVFRLAADAAPGRSDWTPVQAAALVAALHVGVETAGSPLATINELGPTVVAADFGNNAGLILGREIDDWARQDAAALACETWIDGECVGRGGAASIPGGLLAALASALNGCARRGRPLRAGMLVTTGAATGIHDIRVGQAAQFRFGPWGELHAHAQPARGEGDT